MTPEQAWQAALGQLQMEMPKATFDTWVRDTRLIAFTDDNGRHDDKPVVFTLGFVNAYARDWVESRLESTLRRILVGVLGQEVKLQFEIHYDKPERFEPETSLDHQREIETDPDGDETLSTEDARFAILRTSLEEAILQPERIVAVPGYFLRWLPYLGPGRGWVVVALRQAFYETYGKTAFANAPFEASGEQVARWAGTTRRTFQNYIAALEADPLAWFVSRGESGEGQANTYRFRLAMPLTPGDADRLRNWLIVNGVKTDPESALQRALELQPKQILPYPAQVPTRAQLKRKPNPRTVQQVILETCKIQPDSEPYQAVAKLAKKLENRLLPQKDQLIISHYFLLHWLPLLGPGPA